MNTDILNIHTKKVINKKSVSNFRFKFNEIKNIVELKLLTLEIPKTIYQFTNRRDNNSFILKVNDNEYKFTLSEGNHSIISLVVEITKFLNDISGNPVTINFNISTLKIKFMGSVPFSIDFRNSTIYTRLGLIIGFEEEIYENVLLLENNGSITIDLDKYFLLYLNGLGYVKYNNNTYFSKIVLEKKVFDIVYIGKGSENRMYKFNQPVDLDYFDIILHDEFGVEVDLNGIEISMAIEVKYINNSYLKKFYENFQYDYDLSKKILYDTMLKYYYDKTKNIKIEEKEDILKSIVDQPGAEFIRLLSEYKDKSLEKKDKSIEILENNILLSPNQIAINNYRNNILDKKNKKLEIKKIKDKFKY